MQIDIIGTTVGISGILFGYYLYRVGRRVKEPSWSIRSNNLIRNYGSRLAGLRVQFGDQDVQNLTVSRILFWNAGGDTIRKSDITSANPLKIIPCNDAALLEARVLSASSESNKVSCIAHADQKGAFLEFDYLDRDQGAVIQIVHTGTSSNDLTLVGDIIGAPLLLSRRIERARFLNLPTPQRFDDSLTPTTRRRINACVPLVVGIGLLFLCGWFLTRSWNIKLGQFNWIVYGQAAILGIAAFYQLQKSVRIWTHGPPKGLELFEQNF